MHRFSRQGLFVAFVSVGIAGCFFGAGFLGISFCFRSDMFRAVFRGARLLFGAGLGFAKRVEIDRPCHQSHQRKWVIVPPRAGTKPMDSQNGPAASEACAFTVNSRDDCRA